MPQKWYKLDNAAKIFPAVSNRSRSNIFRFSFDMKEEVDPLLLQKALEIMIKRYPMINVKLRRGFFWYYFENNDQTPLLQEEDPFVCKSIEDFHENNGFMFRLYYFDKRITIELFHSLTDGSGGLEFLKSIVYSYLQLQDVKISTDLDVLREDIEVTQEELQDSFIAHYNPDLKVGKKMQPALKFHTPQYDHHWLGIISGTADVTELKKVSKKYNCTINELLTAVIAYSAYQSRHLFEKKQKPFTIMIPVNLRRFFPSKTLRNFSLYVMSSIDLNQPLTFEKIVEITKQNMKEELNKEVLQQRFTFNVRSERHFAMRIVPRFIKEFVLRYAYYFVADQYNSMTISNLGFFDLPEEMKAHIDKVSFINGASKSAPLNMGVITFNNKITMSFTTALIDRAFEREFFRFLTNEGVDIVIENNELEV